MYFAHSNIKYLRKHAGLSQTDFGKLFKPALTRGMVDSYERQVAKPSPEIVQQIAIHFGLTSDIVNFKDISKNPGILFMKKSAKELTDHTNADLLKAKDEMIFELKERIKALEKQNSILLKQFEKKQ